MRKIYLLSPILMLVAIVSAQQKPISRADQTVIDHPLSSSSPSDNKQSANRSASSLYVIQKGESFLVRTSGPVPTQKSLLGKILRGAGLAVVAYQSDKTLSRPANSNGKNPSVNNNYWLMPLGAGIALNADQIAGHIKGTKQFIRYTLLDKNLQPVKTGIVSYSAKSLRKNSGVILRGEATFDGFLSIDLSEDQGQNKEIAFVLELTPAQEKADHSLTEVMPMGAVKAINVPSLLDKGLSMDREKLSLTRHIRVATVTDRILEFIKDDGTIHTKTPVKIDLIAKPTLPNVGKIIPNFRANPVVLQTPKSHAEIKPKLSSVQDQPPKGNQIPAHTLFFIGLEAIRNKNKLEPQEDDDEDNTPTASKPSLKLMPPVIEPAYGECGGGESEDDGGDAGDAGDSGDTSDDTSDDSSDDTSDDSSDDSDDSGDGGGDTEDEEFEDIQNESDPATGAQYELIFQATVTYDVDTLEILSVDGGTVTAYPATMTTISNGVSTTVNVTCVGVSAYTNTPLPSPAAVVNWSCTVTVITTKTKAGKLISTSSYSYEKTDSKVVTAP